MSFDLSLINGDIKLLKNGQVKTCADTAKIRQDVIKIILTALGSNKKHLWYGCNIGGGLLYKNISDTIVFSAIDDSIREALNNLMKLQRYQSGYQEVSSAEFITKVLGISSSRDPADIRQINIKVSLLTKRLTVIEETFTIAS